MESQFGVLIELDQIKKRKINPQVKRNFLQMTDESYSDSENTSKHSRDLGPIGIHPFMRK